MSENFNLQPEIGFCWTENKKRTEMSQMKLYSTELKWSELN